MRKNGLRRLFSVILALALMLTTMPFSAITVNAVINEFAGGSGTEKDPYLIETKYHLNNVRNDLNAHYKLIADIEFSDSDFIEGGDFYNDGNGWESIVKTSGSYYYEFTGTFDGNNHSIDGLSIYADSSNLGYIGLFGAVSGEIKDLQMHSVNISLRTSRHSFIGCLTGSASNATITNCQIQGKVTIETAPSYETTYVGGICGYMSWSDIVSCTNEVDIICDGAFDRVGGICGAVQEGGIKQSINYGEVKGTDSIGGISGEIVESTISSCTNVGKVQSTGFSGTLGDNSIAGYDGEAGGIVAHSNSLDKIIDCFNNAEIISNGTAGGIVGFSSGAAVKNSYNSGVITANTLGGLIGWNTNATFENCYFIDSTANAIGYGSSASGSTVCSIQELKNKETFVGFDFDTVWEFIEGNAYLYPTLKIHEYFIIDDDSDFNAGEGTENNPYYIASKKQLNNVRNHLNSYYKLVRNISFTAADFAANGECYNSNNGWLPIGTDSSVAFTGVFDGNGYTINNLYIKNIGGEFVGLFGYNDGIIKNLSLIEADVYVRGQVGGFIHNISIYAGIIAGYSSGSILNSCSFGSIYATAENAGTPTLASNYKAYIYVGGIVGFNGDNRGVVENCYNNSSVTTYNPFQPDPYAGGIAGGSNGTIRTSYNLGVVSSTISGGIIGQRQEDLESVYCYYLDNISTGVGSGTEGFTKCTLSSMSKEETFDGFDFTNVWTFDNSLGYKYPILQNGCIPELNNTIEFAGGCGTEAKPYLIATKTHLNNVQNYPDAHYKMISDITFNETDFAEGGDFFNDGKGWMPIGKNKNSPFVGVFDGNGFSIENLQINLCIDNVSYIGLFGYSKGEIKNLKITDIHYIVDAADKEVYVGGIVGCSEANISSCSAEGKIQVTSTSSQANCISVGGIIGAATNSSEISISNCISNCNVEVTRNITSTESSGSVALTYVAGIIGTTGSNITLSQCGNIGEINTTYYGNHLVEISSAGIIGRSSGESVYVECCYNLGNISAYSPDADNIINNHAGGIAGDNYSIIISKCYNSGDVISNHDSGGIFACTTSTIESRITDCFNVGNVKSSFASGGIGGQTEAIITNCYNVGFVEGKIYGGIVGFNNGGRTIISNCFYWDITDKGMGNWEDTATKYDIETLKNSSAYSGFDFDSVWSQSDANYNFPILRDIDFIFEKKLTSIKLKKLPSKLTFLESKDTLDVSGGEIELYYNNGDVETLSIQNDMVSGFDNSKVGSQTLNITYMYKVCSYNVEVTPKSLVSISVTKLPSKLEFLEGKDNLDVANGELTLYYNNGTSDTITLTKNMVTGFNNNVVGKQSLIVTYNSLTTSYDVEIISKEITSIKISTKPTKLEYWEGESFNSAGMIVTAYYNNSTQETITGYQISGFTSTVGTKTITISYGGKTDTFQVTVKSRVPTSTTSTKFTVSGSQISKITAGTTVNTLLSGLSAGQYCKVYKGASEVSGTTAIGTGMTVKIMDGNTAKATYTVVVTGDTNGDGAITITDMLAIKAHVLKKSTLSGAYATAADTSGDNAVTITDFIQVKAKILGKGSITAR